MIETFGPQPQPLRRSLATCLVVITLAGLSGAAAAGLAAAGPAAAGLAGVGPDPTFGVAGRAWVGFPAPGSGDEAWAVALQPDGKRVVAGGSETNGRYDMAFARYLQDGRLDPSFGKGGRATFDASGLGLNDFAFSLAVLPDGKLLAAGGAQIASPYPYGSPTVAVVARLLPDMRPDGSFGEGGRVLAQAFPEPHTPQGFMLALVPDGGFAVGGFANISGVVGGHQAAAFFLRFDAEGRLDPGFGEDGRAIIRLAEDGAETIWGLAAQADGKLVVAGAAVRLGTGGEPPLTLFARFETDGALDASFGEAGIARLASPVGGRWPWLRAVAPLPDGRIVAAGGLQRADFALVQLSTGGELDAAFGDAGLALTDFSLDGGTFDRAFAVAVQPDGSVLVAGGANGQPAVARFTADGRLDPVFGVNDYRLEAGSLPMAPAPTTESRWRRPWRSAG
jgi:uncharacterized delta-60 repeat protein